jgi:hypothetical protein
VRGAGVSLNCSIFYNFLRELLRTPLRRSSHNAASRLLDQASSTLRHPPKPEHIGQTVNARGFAYATCYTLQSLLARGSSTADVLLTKPSARTSGASRFYGFCRKIREPTSGLEPLTCSLRVITQALQGCAGGCKCRIFRGVSFLRLAQCCTVLRSRWYQSGINITSYSPDTVIHGRQAGSTCGRRRACAVEVPTLP